jgi:hypothetical protein
VTIERSHVRVEDRACPTLPRSQLLWYEKTSLRLLRFHPSTPPGAPTVLSQ